ncbi:hypothetical protein ACQ4PT_017756 [Festuca glaucescens]
MGKRPRSEDEEPPRLHACERRRRRRRGRRLHLIVHDYKLGCTVYKLDVDGFRPDKDDDLDSRAQRLPADHAAIRLASPDGRQCDEFARTGSKIFAFYHGRGAMVYDSETSTVGICPPLLASKHDFLDVGHDIYALETVDTTLNSTFLPSMEKLGPAPRPARGEWLWEKLPPPPIKLPGLTSSYAVHPNGSAFFISFLNRGTFSFNTGSLAWTRLGDWALPFRGKAYFVRELDAWVGLCSRNRGYISVCDVISPDGDGRRTSPPACTTVRERVYDNITARHVSASLTYMGNAEFCLLETVTAEGYDIYTDSKPRKLLRLATFLVERRHRNGELRAVNLRTKVYRLPHRDTAYCPTTVFWIGQED